MIFTITTKGIAVKSLPEVKRVILQLLLLITVFKAIKNISAITVSFVRLFTFALHTCHLSTIKKHHTQDTKKVMHLSKILAL